jgi:hypothetical protein
VGCDGVRRPRVVGDHDQGDRAGSRLGPPLDCPVDEAPRVPAPARVLLARFRRLGPLWPLALPHPGHGEERLAGEEPECPLHGERDSFFTGTCRPSSASRSLCSRRPAS